MRQELFPDYHVILAPGLQDSGAGHINAESGLGDGPPGQERLQLLYDLAHNERPAMSA